MAKLKEIAQAYEPTGMKNISELDSVDVNAEIKEEEKENLSGEKYLVRCVEVDGVQYRVPFTVIKDLKAILERKPNLKCFAVSRVGTTKEDTRYAVIPLD